MDSVLNEACVHRMKHKQAIISKIPTKHIFLIWEAGLYHFWD